MRRYLGIQAESWISFLVFQNKSTVSECSPGTFRSRDLRHGQNLCHFGWSDRSVSGSARILSLALDKRLHKFCRLRYGQSGGIVNLNSSRPANNLCGCHSSGGGQLNNDFSVHLFWEVRWKFHCILPRYSLRRR